jgi:broad specificity phosphatase PhoE
MRDALHGLPGVPQEEIPLVEIGVRQARAAGEHLKKRGILPDAAIVSPTIRIFQTWVEYGLPEVAPIVEPRLREQDGGLFERLPLAATVDGRGASSSGTPGANLPVSPLPPR